MAANIFLISISGLSGIWLRYFLLLGFEKISPTIWLGTLVINILGSFAAGVLFEMATGRAMISPETAMILLVGFCGGFTTFSSYSLQNMQLLQQAQYGQFALYFILSPLLGLAAAYGGICLMRI